MKKGVSSINLYWYFLYICQLQIFVFSELDYCAGDNFRTYGESCIYLSSDEMTWYDGESLCNSLGGHLAMLKDREMVDAMQIFLEGRLVIKIDK